MVGVILTILGLHLGVWVLQNTVDDMSCSVGFYYCLLRKSLVLGVLPRYFLYSCFMTLAKILNTTPYIEVIRVGETFGYYNKKLLTTM